MQDFRDRLNRHAEHVKTNGIHCATEETTKQALILPLLDVLGFSPFDPQKVKAEYGANIPGLKASERVDYALFSNNQPVMFIEAKPYTEKLTNHTGQLTRYFNVTPGVTIAAITNGREWRFFTDRTNANIMDQKPFLTVNFEAITDTDINKLALFRIDQFNSEGLRSFAEEQTLLDTFAVTIESCLRDPDADFVRYIAVRSDTGARITPKQIEAYGPIVKQAVAEAISKMVVSGLSAPVVQPAAVEIAPLSSSTETDSIDPNNAKIVTTAAERKILSITQMILEGQAPTDDIVGKDTESYYTVLYQGKVNRWMLRYLGDRGKPLLYFQIELTPQHKELIARAGLEQGPGNSIILPRPENLMKLSGLLFDTLAYCQDDENYRIKKPVAEGSAE